jgi:hypothetical protein
MKLQKCPDCGALPEFHWKDYTFGSSGALKCPLTITESSKATGLVERTKPEECWKKNGLSG